MSMSHHSLTLRSLLVLTIVLGLNGCYKYWENAKSVASFS